MIKLIYFELKKLVNIYYFLIILILIVANIVNIVMNYNLRSDLIFDKGYSQIYNNIKGEITDEKILNVVCELDSVNAMIDNREDTSEKSSDTYTGYIYGDLSVLQTIYDELYYAANYNNMINEKIKILEENKLSSLEKIKNQEYDIMINRLEERSIKNFYNTEGITSFLEYDFSMILIIILVISSAVLLFTIDNDTEMNLIINVSNIGRSKYILSKLITVFFICIITILIFRFLDF